MGPLWTTRTWANPYGTHVEPGRTPHMGPIWVAEMGTIKACSFFLSFFLSLYTARPSFDYYQQVYFVHSGLQDESLQATISKLL